jgi:hypothetical protein
LEDKALLYPNETHEVLSWMMKRGCIIFPVDISIRKMSSFLSVDPLVQSTKEPYGYCYQNPLKFIDPTGMAGEWVPDSDGNLIAEEGDNAQTLADFQGISYSDAYDKTPNEQGGKGSYRTFYKGKEISKDDKVGLPPVNKKDNNKNCKNGKCN